MWNKLHYKQKHELMKSYRNGGYSYREMVNDYNSSYQKFAEGGEKNELSPISSPTTPVSSSYDNNVEAYNNKTDQYLNSLTNSNSNLSVENKRVASVRDKPLRLHWQKLILQTPLQKLT